MKYELQQSLVVLMADDDPEDRMLAAEAWDEAQFGNELLFVEDGEQLLAYLRRQGQYADLPIEATPSLILLDLNMPRKDGREALQEIKTDPVLRQIPVVVFTTSNTEVDIAYAYALGANSFITKPISFEALIETFKMLGIYWLETVALPPVTAGSHYA